MRVSWGLGSGAVAACCCAVALAACGGSSGGYTPSAQQAIHDAEAALRQANGFTLTGALTQNGQPSHLSFSADAKGSLNLSISLGSRAFDVIILSGGGGTFVNGNAAFWTSASGPAAAALAGKWFKFPGSEAKSLTSSLGGLEPTNLPRCLGEGLGTTSRGGKTTVAGKSVVVIHDAGNAPGSAGGELDVATSSPHYPLRLTDTTGIKPGGTVDICNDGKGSNTKGEVTFSAFGKVPAISAPASAQTLPGS